MTDNLIWQTIGNDKQKEYDRQFRMTDNAISKTMVNDNQMEMTDNGDWQTNGKYQISKEW